MESFFFAYNLTYILKHIYQIRNKTDLFFTINQQNIKIS